MAIDMDELLSLAVDENASDIHLAVGIPPKFRINGALNDVDVPPLSAADAAESIGMTMNERQKAILKDRGECDFAYQLPDEKARFRVNVFMDRGNMAAAYRKIDTVIPRPEQLGLPPSVIELYKKKRGMVLVTGPTGSGKSTTLASIINKCNENRSEHIITLEDPIEYVHHHKKSIVNQRELGMDTLSFENALRAALREDPDIILVGEMRDPETISVAITAAETGHLVFSTLHTIGAAATVDRIIDVFPPHQQQQIRIQLAMVIEAVISQQLLPTADDHGRVAAFEVMHATPAIRAQIREAKTHQIESTIQTSRAQGMVTMDDNLLELYRNGMITKESCLSYAQDMTTMKKNLM
ncbi:MAG: type IV pilus twitching motility protein PilT [Lachnospiraceae bacterium]|nr:type IV pilus twitching motility protein PilT [Lachnospiraceae bacterium]